MTVAEVTDSRAFSDFCGVESSNQIPDGDTLGRFRNLLVKNELQEKLFSQVVEQLTARGLILKKGTIVDSTIIAAPTSTKNKERNLLTGIRDTAKELGVRQNDFVRFLLDKSYLFRTKK